MRIHLDNDRLTITQRCRHAACCGFTANGRRIIGPIDLQRCEASVLYGDERCIMERMNRSKYCEHHIGDVCANERLMRLTLDNGRPRDIDTLMALVDARLETLPERRLACPCGRAIYPRREQVFVCCAACGEWSDASTWRMS